MENKSIIYCSKKAFTLAEVLVTLAIIGVVAALTIPVLMKKYQKQVWETEYKNTVSIVSQATKMVMSDNDNSLATAWTDTPTMFNAYLPHLSVAKNCAGLEPQGNCFASDYTRLMGGSADDVGANRSLILSSGISLAFVDYSVDYGIVYIDTNGMEKGPNVMGKDYHRFNVYKATGAVLPSFWDMGTATINARCPDDLVSHVGDTCGIRIMNGSYGKNY